MEIHEITRLKAQKLDEVNFSAIPGALGGMVKQAIMNPGQERVGPVAAVGQEKAVAKALTDPIVKQQAASAYQTWQNGVTAKLKEFNKSDASQLGRNEIETMLKNYVDQRLMPRNQSVDSLGGLPVVKNAIKRAMEPIILNTLANKWRDPSNADAWMKLIKAIRIAAFQSTAGQSVGAVTGQSQPQAQQATQLTPQAQAHLQAMAPGIQALQGYWPRGQTTKVPATSNQAVNAVLSGLGLLI
jgi:hypothetical protein